jgi:phage/plasmid-associated DNA primase
VFEGKETKDTNLINKLTTPEELSGLLNLALIALRQLHRDGGFKDVSVEKIRKEYEENSNTVRAFLHERCVIDLTAPEYYTLTTNVYNEYIIYCKEKNERSLDMKGTCETWYGKRTNQILPWWRQRVLLYGHKVAVCFKRTRPNVLTFLKRKSRLSVSYNISILLGLEMNSL